jgi:hypothetical protein
LLSFNTKQNKHTNKQQKPIFIVTWKIKSLEDHQKTPLPPPPPNPILSKPNNMCQIELQIALHHRLKKIKGCPLPKGRERKYLGPSFGFLLANLFLREETWHQ